MKRIIKWFRKYEDFLVFPVLTLDLALLYVLAFAAGYR